MGTRKTTKGTRTKLTASMADLGSIIRFDSNNFNTFSFSFVLDETLQLKEAPIAYPIVHNSASSLFSNTFEVFHYNLVSVEIGNNIFTDVVVCPSHEPLLSTRDFFKQSLSRPCAFSLKLCSYKFEFPFDLFDFSRIEELIVGCNNQVINTEVNAKNSILQVGAFGINLFGKTKQKETSLFSIDKKIAFGNVPTIKIRLENDWDCYRYLDPTFSCGNAQDVIFEGEASSIVITDCSSLYDWFGLSLFNHFTSLSNTTDSQLGLESNVFKMFVNNSLQSKLISYLMFPSLIDTELQSFSIDFKSSDYFRFCRYLNFSGCSDLHNSNVEQQIYKAFYQESINGGMDAIPPMNKFMGVLAYVL